MPWPKTLPAYGELLVDGGGNLWVAAYATTAARSARWTVFDSTGRVLGGVSSPTGFEVFEIGAAEVLGVARDSLGLERVELLRLNRRR